MEGWSEQDVMVWQALGMLVSQSAEVSPQQVIFLPLFSPRTSSH